MDPQVSNGAGLQDEYITDLLVFGFLQNCSNYKFHKELEVLGHELPVPAHLWEDYDDELQTDGNRSSNFSRGRREADEETEVQRRVNDSPQMSDSQRQEEIIQNIARRLAEVGDSMESSIHPGLVNNLALQFRNVNLSEEERREHLAAALQQVMQTFPQDMAEEKTMLMLAMLLAKKVADHTPSLLRDVFRTTVNFINQNLLAYVRHLTRNETD
ncbi:BH3-interacting domain death agonist isoform X1 [Dasypus novemcinctus]|uniref:BH3-interacting domain death agonist isoform X1 n=1 Tax=Dasypus novemcinctus TaxID=9361 RepID=UPI0003292FC2|nr:BH3-interacting domain death agonist isoform X1 [Dasypus novemcinctus]XP_004456832.2 BH3-interacting domain death agonist isoform X1 [Dasypus novemcinctus]XP_004456834.1 BH3-interacting domain death agonist isoform X1 [Dasypus novemcinctus]XP_012379966.1 BH3-interacting domain death agonist isoform X1 [Dasypus novemcinctus]XP_058138462.1 BH3-interacting domain death agonist isoform X1 [Dasypus novemcinctus]